MLAYTRRRPTRIGAPSRGIGREPGGHSGRGLRWIRAQPVARPAPREVRHDEPEQRHDDERDDEAPDPSIAAWEPQRYRDA